jgi:hypothetical protein
VALQQDATINLVRLRFGGDHDLPGIRFFALWLLYLFNIKLLIHSTQTYEMRASFRYLSQVDIMIGIQTEGV